MSSASLISPPRGALRPRVELHPPYELTYGPAAIELCKRAGQPLDQWQADSLDVMLGLRHDDKFACFEFAEWVSRQNGKGGIGEARVLVGFLGPLREKLILWSAHEYKTAMEAFRRIGWLLGNLGERRGNNLIVIDDTIPIKVINTNGEESYERLDTGQRVRFLARTKGSGRGFSGDCNILDESFALTSTQHSALLPTLSARPNPQLIYLSSPPLDGITGEVMFNLRERAEAGGDDGLGYRDWGLAGDLSNLDDIDLDDPANAAASNPALGIRITMETIRRERRSMSPEDFARERYGIWPRRVNAGGGVIDTELWRALAVERERPAEVVFAVQVSAKRTHTAIAAVGPREDGRLQVSIVEYRTGTHWVADRLAELKQRWDPALIVAQDKGPTGSLFIEFAKAGITETEDRDAPKRGDLVVPWGAEMAIGYGLFVDAVTQARLVHLDEAPLSLALSGAKTRALSGATAWAYDTDPDPAPLLAATEGVWAWLTMADKVNKVLAAPNIW